MLVDIAAQIREIELECDWDYYNGGWLKTVTGIDKSQARGCSIQGVFLSNKNGLNDINPGLFLGCSTEGSRKHQEKCYLLFSVDGKGKVQSIEYTERDDWYLYLRPYIQEFLEPIDEDILEEMQREIDTNPLEHFTDDDLLEEIQRRNL